MIDVGKATTYELAQERQRLEGALAGQPGQRFSPDTRRGLEDELAAVKVEQEDRKRAAASSTLPGMMP
jgi:hypothetical protein